MRGDAKQNDAGSCGTQLQRNENELDPPPPSSSSMLICEGALSCSASVPVRSDGDISAAGSGCAYSAHPNTKIITRDSGALCLLVVPRVACS